MSQPDSRRTLSSWTVHKRPRTLPSLHISTFPSPGSSLLQPEITRRYALTETNRFKSSHSLLMSAGNQTSSSLGASFSCESTLVGDGMTQASWKYDATGCDKLLYGHISVKSGEDGLPGASTFSQSAMNRTMLCKSNLHLLDFRSSCGDFSIECLVRAVNSPNYKASWSTVDPHSLGSASAFCNLLLTGSNHKHSMAMHAHDQHSHAHPIGNSDLKPYFFHTKTSEPRQQGVPILKKTMSPKDSSLKQRNLLTGIGSWINRSPLKLGDYHNSFITRDRILPLLQSLDPGQSPGRATDFFSALDLIVANLNDRFPDDIAVQGLRSAFERLEWLYTINFGHPPRTNQNTRTTTNKRPEAGYQCGSEGSSSISFSRPQAIASTDSRAESELDHANFQDLTDGGRSNQGGPNSMNSEKRLMSIKAKRKKPGLNRRLLACPYRKHDEVHRRQPACLFEGSACMSGVAQHLTTWAHKRTLDFLKLCRNCWNYVLDQEEYRNFHSTHQCSRRGQPKGSSVAPQWYNLYRLLFPESEILPSPYTDDVSWEPAQSLDAQLGAVENEDVEFNFNALSHPQAFLSQNPPAPNTSMPLIPHGDSLVDHPPSRIFGNATQPQEIANQQAEAAGIVVLGEMFSQPVQHLFDLIDLYTDNLGANARNLPREHVDAFCDRIRNRVKDMIETLRLPTPNPIPPENHSTENPPFMTTVPQTHGSVVIPRDNLWAEQLGHFDVLDPDLSAQFPAEDYDPWLTFDPSDFVPLPLDSDHRIFVPDVDASNLTI